MPSGVTDLGTPLPGFKWVIKDMAVTHAGGMATPLGGFSVIDNVGIELYAVQAPWSVSGFTYHFTGTQTVEPFDNIYFNGVDAGWSIRVSGYQLTLP